MFILEERRLRGDVITLYNTLNGNKVGTDPFSKVTNYRSRSNPRVQEEGEEENFVSAQGEITLCCNKTQSKMTWPRKHLTSPPTVPMFLSIIALEGLLKGHLIPESSRGLQYLGLPRARMPRTLRAQQWGPKLGLVGWEVWLWGFQYHGG